MIKLCTRLKTKPGFTIGALTAKADRGSIEVIKLFHNALSLQRENRPDQIKSERGLVFQDTSPVSSDSDLSDILERVSSGEESDQ